MAKKEGRTKEEKEEKKRKKRERKERKKAKRKKEEEVNEAGCSDSASPKEQQLRNNGDNGCEPVSVLEPPVPAKKKQKLEKRTTKQEEKKKAHTSTPARHPFPTDEADHCETPWRAYQDIASVLDQIAEACGKTRKNLAIYDPYYCDGGIKRKLKSLGCHNVINENRDFYQDIENGTVPPHDLLLTNPPYSGDHMEALLKFAANNNNNNNNQKKKKPVPFLLLLPHYVYTKPYFQHYFQSDARGTSSTSTSNKQSLFYLVPPNRYAYEPPSWVDSSTGSTALARGKTQTAPFPTFWYCRAPTQAAPPTSLRYAACTADLPREFKGEFDVTNKRPNPRARKRMAAKKRKQQQQPSAAAVPVQRPGVEGKKKKKKRY